MADTNRVPSFCSICGAKLRTDSTVTGYDVYTGEPLESHTLHCRNQTVTTSRGSLGRTIVSETRHPTWRLDKGVWTVS